MIADPVARRALGDAWPLFVPVVPFALVLGVAITESAMPTAIGWSTNLVIFAGAAQLATVSLAATSTWLTLVATATVINLRHVMYSAALAPRFADQPRWFRWVGPYLLIDQVFALVSVTDLDPARWRRYYLAAGSFFLVGWNVSVTLGLFLGSGIPESWRLGIAPAVMFAGLVVIGIATRAGAVAAAVGALACFVTLGVPNNGGILFGALAGILAGYAVDRSRAESGT